MYQVVPRYRSVSATVTGAKQHKMKLLIAELSTTSLHTILHYGGVENVSIESERLRFNLTMGMVHT